MDQREGNELEELAQIAKGFKSCMDEFEFHVRPAYRAVFRHYKTLLGAERVGSQIREDTLRNTVVCLEAQRNTATNTAAVLQRERDDARSDSSSLRREREDLLNAMDRYNPEVVQRQEELYATAELAEVSYRPVPKVNAKSPIPIREKLRHELSYLVSLEPPMMIDGVTQVIEFRNWLKGRKIVAAQADPPSRAVVSNVTARETETRLCQNPVLYLNDNVFWGTPPEQHGLIICPEFQYGPMRMYAGDCWMKSSPWRACLEEKREVFYTHGGRVHYGGTYLCHSGPSALQLGELGDMKTEILIRALSKDTCAVKRGKKRNIDRELVTIEQLYREGVLTVHVIGLERIGFSHALYESIAKRYNKVHVPLPLTLPHPVPQAPRMPVAPLPVAGPSHLAGVPMPAPISYGTPLTAPVSYAAPPPRHFPNTTCVNPNAKRAREDEGIYGRAAKIARIPSPLVDSEPEDEGYLYYCGTDYYRELLNDDPSMYEDLDIPNILGQFERSGSMTEDDREAREEEGESIYDDEEDDVAEPALFGQ
ncbi:hypothetical protein BV20DRAFT_1115601 [Pilatotrama ljubarskyi]|nr:hypothetical protein BV20DRAFT_1115601 [Pilatotrama ljubarskyi]